MIHEAALLDNGNDHLGHDNHADQTYHVGHTATHQQVGGGGGKGRRIDHRSGDHVQGEARVHAGDGAVKGEGLQRQAHDNGGEGGADQSGHRGHLYDDAQEEDDKGQQANGANIINGIDLVKERIDGFIFHSGGGGGIQAQHQEENDDQHIGGAEGVLQVVAHQLIQVDPGNGRVHVGAVGNGGAAIAKDGAAPDGAQGHFHIHAHDAGHGVQGNAQGAHGGQGGATGDGDDHAGQQGGKIEHVGADDLDAVYHQGGDGAAIHKGAHHDADGEDDQNGAHGLSHPGASSLEQLIVALSRENDADGEGGRQADNKGRLRPNA